MELCDPIITAARAAPVGERTACWDDDRAACWQDADTGEPVMLREVKSVTSEREPSGSLSSPLRLARRGKLC